MIQAIIDNLPLILTTLGAIAGAVVAVVTLLRSRRLEKYIAQAKARETYTVCPHCKKRLPLSDLTFHLPDGAVDNNLDGKPDHKIDQIEI